MKEIKQSLSFKYFLIIILSSLIGGLITYGFSYYQELSSEQILNISLLDGRNQVSKDFNSNIIEANYILKKDSSKINSFFTKTIVVTNTGKKGIEKLDIVINSNNQDIVLLERPLVETEPKDLIDFLKINYEYNSDNKHIISIPLLNKDESIILKYNAYSPKTIAFLDLNAHVRKKDLKINKTNKFTAKTVATQAEKFMLIYIVSVIVLTSLLFFALSTAYHKRQTSQLIETLKKEIENKSKKST